MEHLKLCLIMIPLMSFLGLWSSTALGEVTNIDDGLWAPEKATTNIQSCTKRIDLKNIAEVYTQIGAQKLDLHYNPAKVDSLEISRISKNWAEVKWADGTKSGWIKKESLDADQFETYRKDCETPYYNINPPRDYIGTGNRGNDLGNNPWSKDLDPGYIKNQFDKLKEFYKKRNRTEKYAFINKRKRNNKGMFDTYVVDMTTGEVLDKFDSLIGYKGYGCGDGQSRPGIFRLHHAHNKGASRKSNWGNNWKYYVMQNIGGHGPQWGGLNCGLDNQMVAHSNKYMKGASSRGQRYSAGCFVTSPEKFTQWTEKLAGNALIYNVK